MIRDVSRGQMTGDMWQSLRSHILKQREKRKQEQEQDAAMERHRREEELKRKRDALTLEEIKDQLSSLEARLKDLKNEKHETFLELKKVLNEDEARKRQRETEMLAAHQAQQQAAAVAQQQAQAQQQSQQQQQQQQQQAQLGQLGHPYQYPYLTNSMVPGGARPPQYGHRLPSNSVSAASSTSVTTIHAQTPSADSISQGHLSNASMVVGTPVKRKTPVKRPHESPSPPPQSSHSQSSNFSGMVHNYKNAVSYTPSVPKTTSSGGGGYHLFYPPGGPPTMAYDAKGNPYHILPSGSAVPAESSQHEMTEYESKFYSQMRGINPITSTGSPIIPIQPGQSKPGGISTGFPVQRSTASGNAPLPPPPSVASIAGGPMSRDIKGDSHRYHPRYF